MLLGWHSDIWSLLLCQTGMITASRLSFVVTTQFLEGITVSRLSSGVNLKREFSFQS